MVPKLINLHLAVAIASVATSVSSASLHLPRAAAATPILTWAIYNLTGPSYKEIYYADGALYAGGAPSGATTSFRLQCGLTDPQPPMQLSTVTCVDADGGSDTYNLFVDGPMTGGDSTVLRPVGLQQNFTAARRSAEIPVQRVTEPFGLVEGGYLFYYDAASLSLLYNWVAVPVGDGSGLDMIWWSEGGKLDADEGQYINILFYNTAP